MDLVDILHLRQINGIAQNHITAEELETAAIPCLATITQPAELDTPDSVLMERLTQHVNLQIQHQLALHINITVKVMT